MTKEDVLCVVQVKRLRDKELQGSVKPPPLQPAETTEPRSFGLSPISFLYEATLKRATREE